MDPFDIPLMTAAMAITTNMLATGFMKNAMALIIKAPAKASVGVRQRSVICRKNPIESRPTTLEAPAMKGYGTQFDVTMTGEKMTTANFP